MFSADFEMAVHGYKFAVEVRNWSKKKDALKARRQAYDYLSGLSEERAVQLHEMGGSKVSDKSTVEDSLPPKIHPLAVPPRVQQARISIFPLGPEN